MGLFTSRFSSDSGRTPIKGPLPKVLNTFKVHHRAILGCLFPLILIPWQPEKGRTDITARCMWIWMFLSFLFQPVNIPVTAFIPVFLLPMTGVIDTGTVCKCYFNDNIALFVLGNMMLLMINSCGLDKRVILKLLCSGDNCQFAGKRIIFKACTAAFFMSMISNRLIVSSTIINYLTPIYLNLQSSNKGSEPNYDEMRYIVNNAVQVASAIGSTAFINSAVTPLTMRAIYATNPGSNYEYPDIFNFLQYSLFAFPTTFIMFLLTFSFHMLLMNLVVGKPMSAANMSEVRNKLRQKQSELPKQSCHEVLCLLSYIFFLVVAFTRWCPIVFDKGWSGFYTLTENVPGVKDATVAAIFVVLLSSLPRTCNTLRFILADTRKELGSVKPESAILWWRFTDKNINYAYIMLIGSGIALNTAVRMTGLNKAVSESYTKFLTTPNWIGCLLLICLIAVFFSCTMSGVAACVIFMPAVLNMIVEPGPAARTTPEELQKKLYLAALAVGMGTSYGFTTPFMFTPAYFCNKDGKVPFRKMILYSIVPAIICLLVLWIALYAYAPVIFDPSDNGVPAYATGSAPAPKPSAEGAPVPAPAPAPEAEAAAGPATDEGGGEQEPAAEA